MQLAGALLLASALCVRGLGLTSGAEPHPKAHTEQLPSQPLSSSPPQQQQPQLQLEHQQALPAFESADGPMDVHGE